jgi:hypothetical protein
VGAQDDFARVLEVDRKCSAAGMPGMSPWWRAEVGRFFVSGKPLGIFLVGRGGGKSTTWERVAATVVRYGVRSSPPGQTWTAPFISVGPDDANRRIDGMAAVFRADGLAIVGEIDEGGGKVKPGDDAVKIARAPRGSLTLHDASGNPILVASIAGTIGNVSGPSTVFLMIDEAAKLHDKTTNANPLTEILVSALQTSRGRPGWRGIVCSSAWNREGVHWKLVEQGDNETNFLARIGADFLDAALAGFEEVAAWEQRNGDLVAAKIVREHAAGLRADSPLVPTWVANPTLGNPAGPVPWAHAAMASRMLIQALPESALEGRSRVRVWMRENASVPDAEGDDGADAAAACLLAAQLTQRVNDARMGRRPLTQMPDVMPIAGAPPGDPRYAGPKLRPSSLGGGGLSKRRIF